MAPQFFEDAPRALRRDEMLTRLLASPAEKRNRRRKTLDLTPLAEFAIGYVRGLGVPLIERRNAKGSPLRREYR